MTRSERGCVADPRGLIDRQRRSRVPVGRAAVAPADATAQRMPRLGKTIDVDLAEPYEREDRLVVPMHWWAPGATRLFPHLDGDLEFAPLGVDMTSRSR